MTMPALTAITAMPVCRFVNVDDNADVVTLMGNHWDITRQTDAATKRSRVRKAHNDAGFLTSSLNRDPMTYALELDYFPLGKTGVIPATPPHWLAALVNLRNKLLTAESYWELDFLGYTLGAYTCNEVTWDKEMLMPINSTAASGDNRGPYGFAPIRVPVRMAFTEQAGTVTYIRPSPEST